MTLPIVSIIIPCYNGSPYILSTLESILSQENSTYEIILIDDGSTDDTRIKVNAIEDPRLKYVYQKNAGVAMARNHGLRLAKGNYIIFCDADDVMTSNFISSRIGLLERELAVDFVSGEVQKFNEAGFIEGYFRGTSENAIDEILFYNSEVVTCPSNYCFRKSFLTDNLISFNTILSSTADKFFLLQCSKKGKGMFSKELSKLNYRVVQNSMSHLLTFNLVLDNEKYYQEAVKFDLIPDNNRKKALFLGHFILFASYWKVDRKVKALKYAFMSFFINPFKFIRKCVVKK